MSNKIKLALILFILLIANLAILFWYHVTLTSFVLVDKYPAIIMFCLLLSTNFLAFWLIIQNQKTEAICSLMLSNINELVLIYNCRKKKFIAANQTITEILGCSPQQITTLASLKELVYPEDVTCWEANINSVGEKLTRGDLTPIQFINRFMNQNGETLYLETNCIPIRKGGSFDIITTSRNITEQVSLAQKRQASEKKYRDIVEKSYDCIYSFDQQGIFTFINQAFKYHTGLDPDKYIGTCCLDLVHPDDKPTMISVMENIRKGPVKFRFRICPGPDQIINCLASNWPIFDDHGKLVATMATSINIDRDTILEQQVSDSEERYRSLYNNAQVGLITSRMNGSEIIMANDKFAEMLGYTTPKELEGMLLNKIWTDIRERERLIEKLKNQGSVSNYPARIFCKDKSIKEIELFARYDPNTDNIETNAIDMSEMLRARENAEAANLAKDQFLANISHEIRTPMIGILGSVDLLEQSRLNQEQSTNLAIIRECGEQLLTIINEILNVSKIELGLLTINPEACSLVELFTKTTRIAEPTFKEKGLQLILNLDPKIPAQVFIDQLKLRQVLLNILYNAAKFTSQGIIIIDTYVQHPNNNSFLLVSISDTGIGIPQSQQDKIFEAFTQGDSSTSREFGGTGLGLYICKKIINLMQGEIWVDSCEGKGTIFHFKVPLEIVPADQIIPIRQEQVQEYDYDSSILQFNPIKVLVVEDNALTQKIVGQMLDNYGFEVWYAPNGLECLKVLGENLIDIILMDMQMPVMDGYETTRFIREDSELSNLPIVAMTAHAMMGDREKCLAAGCTSYIAKPFKSEELIKLIKRSLPKDFRNIDHGHKGILLINELMPEFIANLQEMIEELDQAIKKQDKEMIRSISHDIKGTAGMYSFIEISDTAAQMEQAAKESAYQKIYVLNHKINTLFQQAHTKVS